MRTGLAITHERKMGIQKIEFQNLIDYQTTVGGFIEFVEAATRALQRL